VHQKERLRAEAVYLCVAVQFLILDAWVGIQLLVDWLPVIDSCQARPH